MEKDSYIRGGFYIPYYPETTKIDFFIKKLDNTIIHQELNVKDGLFGLDLKKGEYKFMFVNRKSTEGYDVNFAFDVHDHHDGCFMPL